MQFQIIQNAHVKGHFRLKKTVEIVSCDFFIPNISKPVPTIIANRVLCILFIAKAGKRERHSTTNP